MKRVIHTWFMLAAVCVAVLLCSCISTGPVELPVEVPSLESILEPKPALTTGVSDAVTGVPFLDDYTPAGATPMSVLPRTRDGGFELTESGHFAFQAKSYCLVPGKRSPSSEHGAQYAPIKGPRADVVRNVLQRCWKYPEIAQEDIQTLLWAIVSRAKIKDLPRDVRQAANKLLTRKEISRLNGGALGRIPDELMDEALERLPPAAREPFEAQARLREMLTEAGRTYEELEEAAVLFGEPPGEESDRPPRGRWSFHPDGYFVRYCPFGYTRTLITLYVPEPFEIERDERGRIVSLADWHGNVIVTEYDDTIEPATVAGDAGLRGYAFRSVRFVCLDASKRGSEGGTVRAGTALAELFHVTEWKDTGWVFCGVPDGRGRPDAGSDRFADLKERYDWCTRHTKELRALEAGLKTLSGRCHGARLGRDGMEEAMSLAHYAVALQKAMGESPANADKWPESPVGVVKRAWQSAVCRHLGDSGSGQALRQEGGGMAGLLAHPAGGLKAGGGRIVSGLLGYTPSAPPLEWLLAASALGHTGSGSGGHGSFNPAGGAHASGAEDQPDGDSGDGTGMDNTCAKQYRECMHKALGDLLVCKSTCFLIEIETIAGYADYLFCFADCRVLYKLDKLLCQHEAQRCLEGE